MVEITITANDREQVRTSETVERDKIKTKSSQAEKQQLTHKKRKRRKRKCSAISVHKDIMGLDKVELKKELSKFTKRFVFYMLLTVGDMVLGSLLFLYIEHCYSVIPPAYKPMEKSYMDICRLLNFTKLIEDTGNGSVSVEEYKNNMRIKELCDEQQSFKEVIECKLNTNTFSKWFEYTASIGFTVGKKRFFKVLLIPL